MEVGLNVIGSHVILDCAERLVHVWYFYSSENLRDECDKCKEPIDSSTRTCSSLTSLDVHHSSSVLLSEVFEQNHVVPFVGIIDEHSLSPHAQNLISRETFIMSSFFKMLYAKGFCIFK